MARRGHGKGTPGQRGPAVTPAAAKAPRRARWVRRPLPPPTAAPPVSTRMKSGPARPTTTAGNRAPETRRAREPALRRAWRWLMEDTSKADRAADGARAVASPASRRAENGTKEPTGPAAPSRLSRLVGEQEGVDENGEKVLVGPPRSDWRWHVHVFLRSDRRALVYARMAVIALLVLSSTWTAVFATTGFDLTDVVFASPDEDDVSTMLRTPFFVIESGSLMQPGQPFGRLKTIDPGDIVIVERVESRGDVQTFYGTGDRFVANGRGDVVVFLPVATQANPDPSPIVHRAVAYLERSVIQVPNPDPGPNRPAVLTQPRFTVAEFGIYDARAVTIPELGLHNYQPDRSGFITRGDNPRTNNWADQALGVTVHPVPEDRILGRVKYVVPYLGLAKIALAGQDPSMLSPDHEWCGFLAGQAPCDNWVVFLVIVVVFVGVPFLLTLAIFTRRALERQRERREIRRQQDEALTKRAAEAEHAAPISADGDAQRALPVHSALDLLSGRIVPPGAAPLERDAVRRPLRLPRGGLSTGGVD